MKTRMIHKESGTINDESIGNRDILSICSPNQIQSTNQSRERQKSGGIKTQKEMDEFKKLLQAGMKELPGVQGNDEAYQIHSQGNRVQSLSNSREPSEARLKTGNGGRPRGGKSPVRVPLPLKMNKNSSLAKRKIGHINYFYSNQKTPVTAKMSDKKTSVTIE